LDLVSCGSGFLQSELPLGRLGLLAGHFGAIDRDRFVLIAGSRIRGRVFGVGDVSQGHSSDLGLVPAGHALTADALVDDHVVVAVNVVIDHR